MSSVTFPVPSGGTDNRAHHGGLSPGTPLFLAETPVGQQQAPRHHQAPRMVALDPARALLDHHVEPVESLGDGTWGSWGWDLPQLPLTLAKASAARRAWHESPCTGAAPRNRVPPPPSPGSLPTNPSQVGTCPQDQAIRGG